MQQIKLRPYQQEAIDSIYNSWLLGNRNVCAVLPTGAGKAICLSFVAFEHLKRNLNTAIIVHRNELVAQLSNSLCMFQIPHKIIASQSTVSMITRQHRAKYGKSFVNPTAQTAVIGVDTLIARAEVLKEWCQQIDLWITDEQQHLLRDNKWGKAVEMFPNAKGLGVTATPCRADGQGLGRQADGVIDNMIIGPTSRWLIDNGFLADYEIVCPQSDMHLDESDVGTTGDWSNVKMRKAAKKSHIVGDVVKNYIKYGANRKAIVFATDIETADDIAQDFNLNGIKAVSLNGKSANSYREQAVSGFHNGTNRVLVNVDLFDEGFDSGDCDIVIMARPTCSLGKYLQMIGRALRPMEGKTALIIDHVSNVIRHGLPDKPRVWTLDRTNKKAKQEKDPDEIELTTCVACSKPYERFRTVCPYCGEEKPLPEPRSRTIEMVEGDLMLLDRAKLAEMRAKLELESPESVANRVGFVAGAIAGKAGAKRQREKIEAQDELKQELAVWAGYERAKGFDDREIHRRFYLTTGVDVLTALGNDNTRQDYSDMCERIKGWIK